MVRNRGFTLIELLVVISVIALLIALLLPALGMAKEAGNRGVCLSQERQILMGIHIFLEEDGAALRPSVGKDLYEARRKNYGPHMFPLAGNNGYWVRRTGANTRDSGTQAIELDYGDGLAYWGIWFRDYIQDARTVFQCPSAKAMDGEAGFPGYEGAPTSTYGINGYRDPATNQEVLLGQSRDNFARPAQTIVFHDAFEHKLEGPGDSLAAIWPESASETINFRQWRFHSNPDYREHSPYEYYRHLGASNIGWYDGHASSIPESDGTDVPYQWYTGEAGQDRPVATRPTRRG